MLHAHHNYAYPFWGVVMTPLSEIQKYRLIGTIIIKNVSGDDITLTMYNNIVISADQEINLLHDTTNMHIRASDYLTAKNMIGYASVNKPPRYHDYQLAQLIRDGDIIVTLDKQPNPDVLNELPLG